MTKKSNGVKEEHPMQEIRNLAEAMGQIMMPPLGGSVIAPPSQRELPLPLYDDKPCEGGQSNKATLCLMKLIEEQLQQREEYHRE